MASRELEALLPRLRAQPMDFNAGPASLRNSLDRMAEVFRMEDPPARSEVNLGGVRAERHTARAHGPHVLFVHGGGFVIGSPRSHRHLAARLAHEIGGIVDAIEYRLAPEAPFPAALEDVLKAYRALAAEVPAPPALAGDSAGGGLALSAAVALGGEPQAPAAIVAISPWVNLACDNESYDWLAPGDPLLSREVTTYFATHYLAGAPRSDPRASPLFADLRGLPPVLIQVGDRECFLGDAVSLHQRLIAAGVDSELKIWKEMFHVWHLYWPILPEGQAALAEAGAFIRAHAPGGDR